MSRLFLLFDSALFWTILKWLMVFAVVGFFALRSQRENKLLHASYFQYSTKDATEDLSRLLQRRDRRIWIQFSLLVVVMAANDIHRDIGLLPVDFFTPKVTTASVSAAPAPQELRDTMEERYDKILRKNSNSGLPFSNITAFNEQNSKREAYIDWLKERYESWLITYYYLDRCKKTGPQDYEAIHRALKRDLDSAHANEAVEGNILLAANGSYREMYANIPCDNEHLAATKSAYDANMLQTSSLKPSQIPLSGSKATLHQ